MIRICQKKKNRIADRLMLWSQASVWNVTCALSQKITHVNYPLVLPIVISHFLIRINEHIEFLINVEETVSIGYLQTRLNTLKSLIGWLIMCVCVWACVWRGGQMTACDNQFSTSTMQVWETELRFLVASTFTFQPILLAPKECFMKEI